jgi:hypothetical protein
VLLHYGEMQGVSGGQVPVTQDDLFGTFHSREIYSKNFIDDGEQCVKSRLYRVGAVNGDVTVKNFLQDFGICNQSLPFTDQLFEPPLSIALMPVRHANQIHRYVGIDQNHDVGPTAYPRSISDNIWSMSAVGKSCRAALRITSSFLPGSPVDSKRRAFSSACRTHSASDMFCDRAVR